MADQKTGARVALITGANSGIGKDVARQLALSGCYRTILIGSRNAAKGELARAELERATGTQLFKVLPLSLSLVADARQAVASLTEPVDDLILNAGGFGGTEPFKLTKDGVVEIIASNVLGNAVVLEQLLKDQRLTRCGVLLGSDAAKGVPQFGMKRPELKDGSVAEFQSLCSGEAFRAEKAKPTAAYGFAKLIGVLYMGHMARAHPEVRLLAISPGGTANTGAADAMPAAVRALNAVMMATVLPLLGAVHSLPTGAKRVADAVLDEQYKAGVFYSSQKGLTGPVADQTPVFPALGDVTMQDNAAAAVKSFMGGA